ncbi:ankyrin repeat domain-containing protein [Bryobacter aggregatus]|uniref:ankyrin repeat domain-containing protein n=1 Tax=Bryobacter aggregatus TaxID=360054 RepID=UPI00138E04DF|nr:ankyrin repeat domain-containing protein [Bryobacter aggregatus]
MNLEQQKKQAREFLRAIRSGNVDALSRLRRHHARWATSDEREVRLQVSLHDAQFALAREQGFASWPKLKAHADPSSRSVHTRLFETDLGWIKDRVHGLLRTRYSAGPAALEQIREWHPRFCDRSDEEIRQAPFSEEDARLVYAREHGFDTWDDLTTRVKVLASNAAAAAAEPFMSAFAALRSGDVGRFEALLRTNLRLAGERGTNGNTLLNLAVSLASKPDWNGGLSSIEELLAAGSDINQGNNRGWTPLHQAAYANRRDIAALLIEKGAALDLEAHGSGGTPLIVALFWGNREVADLLGRNLVAPNNLRAAAGLGLQKLVEACFRPDGTLTPEACAARGFYRPHSGFPDWRPSTDPQEVLDEALVWACKSNRLDVLERLITAGARPNADPYRGTPLIWASVCNRPETVSWLLDHGAEINQKATFGGLTHGQGITALHLAAQYGHMAVVRLLVDRGADRSIKDDLYRSTAESAANHFGQCEVRDYLNALRT